VPVPDRLIAALRRYSQTLPDGRLSTRRRGRGKNTTYAMEDFALAAFAPFFMQHPSFLAHQRYLETGQGRSNCQTLFGVDKIPCDNQIRAMLDPVEPTYFYLRVSMRQHMLTKRVTRCSPTSWPNSSNQAAWTRCAAWAGTC
jgi:hypothetical protein